MGALSSRFKRDEAMVKAIFEAHRPCIEQWLSYRHGEPLGDHHKNVATSTTKDTSSRGYSDASTVFTGTRTTPCDTPIRVCSLYSQCQMRIPPSYWNFSFSALPCPYNVPYTLIDSCIKRPEIHWTLVRIGANTSIKIKRERRRWVLIQDCERSKQPLAT